MSTNQQELLRSQTNAEEVINSTSSKLIEREEIPGSPYYIIGNEEKGYHLVFGKYKLTHEVTTKEEVLQYFHKNIYNIILQTILAVIHTESIIINPLDHEQTK